MAFDLTTNISNKIMKGTLPSSGHLTSSFSRRLNSSEQKLPPLEQEMATIIWTLKKTTAYTYGASRISIYSKNHQILNSLWIQSKKWKKTIEKFRDQINFFPETSLPREIFSDDNLDFRTSLSPIPEENNISFESSQNQNDSELVIPSILMKNSNREFLYNHFFHPPSEQNNSSESSNSSKLESPSFKKSFIINKEIYNQPSTSRNQHEISENIQLFNHAQSNNNKNKKISPSTSSQNSNDDSSLNYFSSDSIEQNSHQNDSIKSSGLDNINESNNTSDLDIPSSLSINSSTEEFNTFYSTNHFKKNKDTLKRLNQLTNIRKLLSSKNNYTIIFEGNIGCGKTTMLNLLKKYGNFHIETFQEPLSLWTNFHNTNLLELTYSNPKKWATPFQLFAMSSMIQNHLTPSSSPIKIMERSVWSTKHCFITAHYLSKNINRTTYEIFNHHFNLITEHLPIQMDLIVYIKTSPKISYERIKKRNRPEEQYITLKYVKLIHSLYQKWLNKNDPPNSSMLITINGKNTTLEMLEELNSKLPNSSRKPSLN